MILSRQEKGLPVPENIKRRDRREPRRTEKEKMEDNINGALRRYWRQQKRRVMDRLTAMFPDRKNFIPVDDIFDQYGDDYNKIVALMVRYILAGVLGGVELFSENINIGLDWTLVNKPALDFAHTYAFDLIKDIDETSRERVGNAIQTFIDTPGFTMGDIEKMLPFSETRSRMIAVTETTRAYAHGQQMAADELKKQYPDVRVTKTWFTNNDEKVCELCAPLDGVEINFDENFYEPDEYSDGNPPRHSQCRCWLSEGTRING